MRPHKDDDGNISSLGYGTEAKAQLQQWPEGTGGHVLPITGSAVAVTEKNDSVQNLLFIHVHDLA